MEWAGGKRGWWRDGGAGGVGGRGGGRQGGRKISDGERDG